MKTRDATLLYQNVESDTKVEITELNFRDPISAISLEVTALNGATSNKGNWISDIVTKIEVVDGSTVLAALNMFQLEYLHWLKTRQLPRLGISEWASDNQEHSATLFFGRHLWDENYALDPTAWTNPQLKITFNKAAIRAASATGFATGDNIKLTAVAKVMEGMTPPSQFLMQKQIDSFTPATTGEKRIDLPRDYEYRSLLLRAYLQNSEISEIISDLKLTCDTDAFVPLNRKVRQLGTEARGLSGTATARQHIRTKNNEDVRTIFDRGFNFSAIGWSGTEGQIISANAGSANNLQLAIRLHDGTTPATDANYAVMLDGWNLHATLPVIFGKYNEPGTWFNPRAFGKLELVLTQALASGTVEIVAEQVRPQTRL